MRKTLLPMLALLAGVLADATAEGPDFGEIRATSGAGFAHLAPADAGVEISIFVLRGSGWSGGEIVQALRTAARIYARACRFELRPAGIRYLDPPAQARPLDERLQTQILTAVDESRPAVFFVGEVSDRVFAYAYRQGTISPSQGTAWISRHAPRRCHGVLLAHELGHILLDVEQHSRQPDNMMAKSCRHSNLAGDLPSANLTRQQCERLWRRNASADSQGG